METYTKSPAELMRDNSGKYFLINLLAQRAKALNQGARPAVPYQEGASAPMQTAIDELLAGRIGWKPSTPIKQ